MKRSQRSRLAVGEEEETRRTHVILPSVPPRHLVLPPQMTRVKYRVGLHRLLEQSVAVQRRLGDERVVIVASEHPRPLQAPDDNGDGLELSSRIRDRLLVDDECLNVELVRELLETRFVGDLGGEEEEAKASLRRFDPVVEDGDDLVDKLEYSGELCLPGFVLRSEEGVMVSRRARRQGRVDTEEKEAVSAPALPR